mmetsp:Transcript_45448/g.110650  ORF Transcript_45448/g.110650 Transcript_45448/m.110650 type:complete len:214 (-) Transcript_45448:70-711(-)
MPRLPHERIIRPVPPRLRVGGWGQFRPAPLAHQLGDVVDLHAGVGGTHDPELPEDDPEGEDVGCLALVTVAHQLGRHPVHRAGLERLLALPPPPPGGGGGKRKEAFQPGTVHWMAPELMRDGYKSEATDIFALGIVLWELWVMRTPYAGMKVNDIAKLVREGGRPELPPSPDPEPGRNGAYDALMREAWHEDARRRPSAAEVEARLSVLLGGL